MSCSARRRHKEFKVLLWRLSKPLKKSWEIAIDKKKFLDSTFMRLPTTTDEWLNISERPVYAVLREIIWSCYDDKNGTQSNR